MRDEWQLNLQVLSRTMQPIIDDPAAAHLGMACYMLRLHQRWHSLITKVITSTFIALLKPARLKFFRQLLTESTAQVLFCLILS